MADKRKLQETLMGIVGKGAEAQEQVDLAESKEQKTPKKPEEKVKKRGPGRPKLAKKKPRDHRATFIVTEDMVRKIKFVSAYEGTLMKDTVQMLLERALETWQADNVKIKLKDM